VATIEAKPCPWCGPADDESETPMVVVAGGEAYVMCRLCGATGPESHGDEHTRDEYIIGIWNRREAEHG
jgi:hypothetical protein